MDVDVEMAVEIQDAHAPLKELLSVQVGGTANQREYTRMKSRSSPVASPVRIALYLP